MIKVVDKLTGESMFQNAETVYYVMLHFEHFKFFVRDKKTTLFAD